MSVRGWDATRARLWWWFTLAGLIGAGLYAANVAVVAAFAVVGIGGVVSLFAGVRLHRIRPGRPWQLLGTAAMLCLIGALLRPLVSAGGTNLLADLFTLPGYFFMIASLTDFAYSRRGIDRHALIDGLIVCVGAGVGSILLFALPAASIGGRSPAVSLLAGLYPILDALLVLLVSALAFTTVARQPSFVLLLSMMLVILVGDVAYAVIGASGYLYGTPLLDLPFLLAYVFGGAAALHPSARELVKAVPLPVQAWSWRRLLVIGPAVAVPFVLTVALPEKTPAQRWVLGIGGAVIMTLVIIRSISAVQSNAAAQRRAEYQANHDELTGLPNRRRLTAEVDRLLAGAAPADGTRVWVLFLDLDGFKFINDSWGHSAGDRLIVDVGQQLRGILPADTTIARIGGDEFVIVCCGAEADAVYLARQIIDCVARPLHVAGAEVVISGSIGIVGAVPGAEASEDGLPAGAESLMRDADTAMYRAKSAGRGGWVVFDSSMREAVRTRLELESALRGALGGDELRLVYQPIVTLVNGRPCGAEALIRWHRPGRGLIPPCEFIPVAEESRLISAIGGWVLHEAIQQLAQWRDAGVVRDDFLMSINVSPRQLTEPGFGRLVAEELALARVPAGCVNLEITESVIVDGSDTTEKVLRDLRALGLFISVDDFGTGYSALGYLRRHPVTGVKIDRSFVAGLGTSPEDEEIVRAVVAMSDALGLSVVAEGVETTAQRAVLERLGVRLCQGWLWGAGVEPVAFSQRWARGATPLSASREQMAWPGS